MKKRLKEMEDEAAALREMQAKVEKEMGSVQGCNYIYLCVFWVFAIMVKWVYDLFFYFCLSLSKRVYDFFSLQFFCWDFFLLISVVIGMMGFFWRLENNEVLWFGWTC
jgi:hypothetical protein